MLALILKLNHDIIIHGIGKIRLVEMGIGRVRLSLDMPREVFIDRDDAIKTKPFTKADRLALLKLIAGNEFEVREK